MKACQKKVWFCKFFNERREFELVITGIKLFLRYLDYIVRTPKGNGLAVGASPAVILTSL